MKVVKIVEQEDGSALLNLDITTAEELFLRKEARKQKKAYNEEFVGSFMRSVIRKALKKEKHV